MYLPGGHIMHFKLTVMFFSPTGTTKKVMSNIAERISKKLDNEILVNYIDFTLPEAREEPVYLGIDDILVIGVPVYAGRVPNVLLRYLYSISGNGASAVPVVVYGNREYDDALIELNDILQSNGFNIIAAGAFIGEHAFSYTLANGRPDNRDLEIINEFADRIGFKLMNKFCVKELIVTGNRPYRSYYIPKDKNGQFVDLRKVTPRTNSNCIDCKLCAEICPMGSINFDDVTMLNGICIKCCACIKRCPVQAKYFDNTNYLQHKRELEIYFSTRREPDIFL